jgi:hypothetical protein
MARRKSRHRFDPYCPRGMDMTLITLAGAGRRARHLADACESVSGGRAAEGKLARRHPVNEDGR